MGASPPVKQKVWQEILLFQFCKAESAGPCAQGGGGGQKGELNTERLAELNLKWQSCVEEAGPDDEAFNALQKGNVQPSAAGSEQIKM